MATKNTAVKGVQVSATISQEKFAALEDHRWDVRKSKAEVVATAIDEYLTNHGIAVTPEPAEDSPEA